MNLNNGIEVADKSIRRVPIGLWMKFAGYCKGNGITITKGIVDAITEYLGKREG